MKKSPEEWVYVGNLPFLTKEEDIRTLFEGAEKIEEINMQLDPETSRFMGFSYIHLGSARDAKKAAEMLNNKLVEGRPIRVITYDEVIRQAKSQAHD